MFTAYTLLTVYSIMLFFTVFSKKTVFALFSFLSLSVPLFLLYYSYNAPDVALTETSIGAFLSFIFFYKTYSRTSTQNAIKPSNKINKIKIFILLILFIAIFSLMFYTCMMLENILTTGEYSSYYIQNTYKETGVENTVTAILASYRAFDTLGETMIILISSIGIGQISKSYKSFR
jgi:multicomponent Na+:H+ antiporter subunit B